MTRTKFLTEIKHLVKIGSTGHDWSEIDPTPGLVTGVDKAHYGSYFGDVADLNGFKLLKKGECLEVEDASSIDVLEFNADEVKLWNRTTSYAKVLQVDFMEGGVLHGPIAWRESETYTEDDFFSRIVLVTLISVLAIMVSVFGYFTGYFWQCSLGALGLIAFISLIGKGSKMRESSKFKKISQDGSFMIFGPTRKYWT